MRIMFLLLLTLARSGFAATYDIECLNAKGKFSPCKVAVENGTISIQYKSKKEQTLNATIPGKNIRSLSAGEYSRRRVAEAVLLSPWILFSKKQRDQISMEYEDGDVNTSKTLQIKKKYGAALKSELRALSGKPIEEK